MESTYERWRRETGFALDVNDVRINALEDDLVTSAALAIDDFSTKDDGELGSNSFGPWTSFGTTPLAVENGFLTTPGTVAGAGYALIKIDEKPKVIGGEFIF